MSRLMPALSDGRAFTNYLSAGQAELALQRHFRTPDENSYRRFLQHNATRVARELRRMQESPGGIPPLAAPRR